jgi:hypothetical protein
VQYLLTACVTCQQAILHATLQHTTLSVEKFSRWLRAICTIILARNNSSDRAKAVGYIEQAVSVMEQHDGDGEEVRTLVLAV